MKNPKSLFMVIPVIILSIISAACAFSLDLGGQSDNVEPTATVTC